MINNFPAHPSTTVLVKLLERVAVQDVIALKTLYDLTFPCLFAIALRILRRREFAEEVLQDSFVNIWKFAADYRSSVSPPMAWMAVVVRNRTFDYLRRGKSLAGPEIEWTEVLDHILAAETPDPLELAVSNQKIRNLTACMSLLDANPRRALQLSYFHDLTHKEIAEEMKAPLGTVKAWIRRATASLKISLGAYDEIIPSTSSDQRAGFLTSAPVRINAQKKLLNALSQPCANAFKNPPPKLAAVLQLTTRVPHADRK